MLHFDFETTNLSIKAIDTLCGLIDKLQEKYPKNTKCHITGALNNDILETMELSGWNVSLKSPENPKKTIKIFRKLIDESSYQLNTIYLCSESGALYILVGTS
jgi:hypothetical protein